MVMPLVLFCGTALLASQSALALPMSLSPVGSPGNTADTADGDSEVPGVQRYGAVGYAYKIGTYDVTVTQYVEFLNAADATGANSLGIYNSGMSNATYGGVNFTAGNANGSKYSVIAGKGDRPINYVSWYDAIRFANWLTNGGQAGSDTETGSYTLGKLGAGGVPINGAGIVRSPSAVFVLPSENEWYKAAYYNPVESKYYSYGTSSNILPSALQPGGGWPIANYDHAVGNLTDVGAYYESGSPFGAFDMAGNVAQWTEGLDGSDRIDRGGTWGNGGALLKSSSRGRSTPTDRTSIVGFRLAMVPEPSSWALAVLAACLCFWSRKRWS